MSLLGKTFGKLIVLKESSPDIFLCKCECGRSVKLLRSLLTCRVSRDCGSEEHGHRNRIHGHLRVTRNGRQLRTREYNSWLSMRYRCLDPKATHWENYGGRGIRICERWSGKNGFINFLNDLGPRPLGTSLERENVNGHYEPSNCKWATPVEQRSNQRRSQDDDAPVVMVPDQLEAEIF